MAVSPTRGTTGIAAPSASPLRTCCWSARSASRWSSPRHGRPVGELGVGRAALAAPVRVAPPDGAAVRPRGGGGGKMSQVGEGSRADFPILSRVVNGSPLIYLDSAASSQKPRQVIEAITTYYERSHANVHRSIPTLGEEATELYEGARDAVRRVVGARRREEIIFTRGTTEAINLVAQCVGRTLRPGDEIIVTEMEHHSNLIPWQMVCRDHGAVLKAVPVIGEGFLDMEAFARLLSPRTRVVAAAHVSNVLGTINPVMEIVRRSHEAGALVLLDGAQGAPHLALDLAAMGADFYVFSGHKM